MWHRIHSLILWLSILYHPTPPTPRPGRPASKRAWPVSYSVFDLSLLGLTHGRHLINISRLNEARSADSRLWGNNPCRLNTDPRQLSRCSHWSLLYCSLCMAMDGRELSWAGHCLYEITVLSLLCANEWGLNHNVPSGFSLRLQPATEIQNRFFRALAISRSASKWLETEALAKNQFLARLGKWDLTISSLLPVESQWVEAANHFAHDGDKVCFPWRLMSSVATPGSRGHFWVI